VQYGQFKNNSLNGYGIHSTHDGEAYRGHFKDYEREGYGCMKYSEKMNMMANGSLIVDTEKESSKTFQFVK